MQNKGKFDIYLVIQVANSGFYTNFKHFLRNAHKYDVLDLFFAKEKSNLLLAYYFPPSPIKCIILPGNVPVFKNLLIFRFKHVIL